MSDRAAYPRERRGFFRTLGMLVAIGLCGAAVYLVVVGHTQKQVQIGLLVGLWGALIGAFALFGPRRERMTDADEVVAAAARKAPEAERGLARRRDVALEREVAMRREMERVLRDELTQLRDAVTGLRNDLNENAGAQLRMERIEATRFLSSELDERPMRQLTGAHPGSASASNAADRAAVIDVTPHPYARPAPHPAQRPAIASIEGPVYPPTVDSSRSTVTPPATARPAAGAGSGPSAGATTFFDGAYRGAPGGPPTGSSPGLPPPQAPRPAAASSDGWSQSTTSAGSGTGRSERAQNWPAPRDDAMSRSWPSHPSTPSAPPAPAAPPMPPRAPEPGADPLAGLPRLSRFDYDWDEPARPAAGSPIDSREFGAGQRPVDPPASARPIGSPRPAPSPYVGRRRSANDPAGLDALVPEPMAPRPYSGGNVNGGNPQNGIGYGAARYGSSPDGIAPTGGPHHVAGNSGYGSGPNGANGTNGGVGYGNGTPGYGNGAPAYPNGASATGNGAPAYPNGPAPNGGQPVAGGRRRRAEDEANEIMARLLGR